MVIKDWRSRSLPSFLFSAASLASSLSLFICESFSPLLLSFCLCSCNPHSSNPLLSPLCAGTPSNYLTTALKQTNICLEAGPDPVGRCLPAVNTPATASLTPRCPAQTQARHATQSARELRLRLQTVDGPASKCLLRFGVGGLQVVIQEICAFLHFVFMFGAKGSFLRLCSQDSTCQSN